MNEYRISEMDTISHVSVQAMRQSPSSEPWTDSPREISREPQFLSAKARPSRTAIAAQRMSPVSLRAAQNETSSPM